MTLRYPGGGEGRLRLDGTTLRVSFTAVPEQYKQFRMEMLIPITFGGGKLYDRQCIGPAISRRKASPGVLYQGSRSNRGHSPDWFWSGDLDSCLLIPAVAG